jgi:hypothetical protein
MNVIFSRLLKCYTFLMNSRRLGFLILSTGLYLPAPTFADYTIVLKNGRRMTVQSYREEGSTIKVPALGGEFGIPKEQIETILNAGQTAGQGLNISDLATSKRESPTVQKPTRILSPDSQNSAVPINASSPANAEEAKDYQKRLSEVSQKLELAKQQYYTATQGGGTASNVSKEGLKAWAMDLASRIHDSQKMPGGGGAQSSPPSQPYAPSYTAKEKELSNLRIQIDGLQKERDELIDEMNSKNIPVGPQ